MKGRWEMSEISISLRRFVDLTKKWGTLIGLLFFSEWVVSELLKFYRGGNKSLLEMALLLVLFIIYIVALAFLTLFYPSLQSLLDTMFSRARAPEVDSQPTKEGSIMNYRSRFLPIFAASFLIGILIGFIIHTFQIYQLQAEWISLLSSIILTGITGMFVLQNRNILTEMMKARNAESLPNISANLGYPGALSIDLIIKNTGKGPAFEVDLNYGFEPIIQKLHVNWLQPLISPEEEYTFWLEPNNFNDAASSYDYLIVSGTCKDIFGQEHEIDEKIDLKENYKGYSTASMLYQDTIERRLNRIASEVKKMGSDIESSLRARNSIQ